MKLNINDVIHRAVTDEAFAVELREKAQAASNAGAGSNEHKELLSYFADSPEALEQMLNSDVTTLGWTTTTTVTTYTTTTTVACTTTATTTTTTTTTTN